VAKDYSEPELLNPTRRQREAYLFLIPALAVLLLFFLYPILWLLSVSISDYDAVTGAARTADPFMKHYQTMLGSPGVWRGILNMAYFGLFYIPLTLVFGAGLAVLLKHRVGSRPLIEAIMCSPFVVPVVGAALIWRAAYMPYRGSIDRLLYMLFGYEHAVGWSGWLGEPYLAMPCIALMCVWRDTGFIALILLSAMARVPRQLYDQARVDGATMWQRFVHITAPMCRGTVVLCLIMLVINVQNIFQEIYVMTEDGGPANWTVNIPFLVYRRAYIDHEWGPAAALSIIVFAVTFVVILVQNRLLNRRLDWS
jgi:multiple sugar transport system permease protein